MTTEKVQKIAEKIARQARISRYEIVYYKDKFFSFENFSSFSYDAICFNLETKKVNVIYKGETEYVLSDVLTNVAFGSD